MDCIAVLCCVSVLVCMLHSLPVPLNTRRNLKVMILPEDTSMKPDPTALPAPSPSEIREALAAALGTTGESLSEEEWEEVLSITETATLIGITGAWVML